MKLSLIVAGALALCVTLSTPAHSTGVDVHGFTTGTAIADVGGGKPLYHRHVNKRERSASYYRRHDVSSKNAFVGDPRPRAWCGWQLRQWLHVADKKFNLARNWVHYGSPAAGPAPGVIAVFARGKGGHVGIITAVPKPGVIVLKSGNDGHAVRERERSTRGIIAYRWPPGTRVALWQVPN